MCPGLESLVIPVTLMLINQALYVNCVYQMQNLFENRLSYKFYLTSSILKKLRNTNPGNLIVRSYWWPAIILLAIFFGPIWCMICPVEVITTFFAKVGLKRKRSKWLLSGMAITIFYILIIPVTTHLQLVAEDKSAGNMIMYFADSLDLFPAFLSTVSSNISALIFLTKPLFRFTRLKYLLANRYSIDRQQIYSLPKRSYQGFLLLSVPVYFPNCREK